MKTRMKSLLIHVLFMYNGKCQMSVEYATFYLLKSVQNINNTVREIR